MVCPACGSEIAMGASFCSKCGRPAMAPAAVPTPLFRPRAGRAIAGVCAGLALRYGWEVVIVRLVAVLGVFLGGSFVLAYVIAWIVMPEEPWGVPPMPPPSPPAAV